MSNSNKRNDGKAGIMKAAGILVIANMLSSILGYVRDIIMSSVFDIGKTTDAYNAAFTIPDLIYTVLVGGGLSAAFIPVFSSYIADKKYKDGYRMASSIINLVAISAAIVCILGEIFAPQLLPMIVDFRGWGPEAFHLTVRLTRIMFIQCFFMCLTGICMGILQSYKNFTPPSVGSVLYNITIIVVGVVLLTWNFGIMGFSIGVVLGAVVNLMVQVFPIKREGFKYEFKIDLGHEGVKKFFRLFWPVLLGISVQQINLIVNRYFGSGQGKGILSSMTQAQRIMQLPINIFAYAIAMSIFPTMVEHFTHGRMNSYKKDLSMGIRNVAFIILPASVGLISIRIPFIRAIYLQGNFSPENVPILANLLMFYCIGMIGYSVRHVTSQGFYAIQETLTPVCINIFILIFNMVLSFAFVKVLGANGIAIAYSTAGLASMTLQLFFLKRKVGTIRGKEIGTSILKSLISCAVMSALVDLETRLLEKVLPMTSKKNQIIEVLLLLIVGAAAYVITAYILKMEELQSIIDIFKKRFKRK